MKAFRFHDWHIQESGDPYGRQPYLAWHDNYDGAPDSGDHRSFTAKTIEELKEYIYEYMEENDELSCCGEFPNEETGRCPVCKENV